MQSTKRVARGYSTMNSLSCLQEIVRFSILKTNMEELPTESATIEIQEGKGWTMKSMLLHQEPMPRDFYGN